MILSIFSDVENLVEKGFPGLAVIFLIILFYLFRRGIPENLQTKDFIIRILPFSLMAILLLLISAFFIYSDKKSNQNLQVNNFNVKIDSLERELNYCKGLNPEATILSEKAVKLKKVNDSLQKVVENLGLENVEISTQLKNKISKIANDFENAEVNIVEGEGETIRYNRIKNTVFQKMLVFAADEEVLKEVCKTISSRGFKFDINKLMLDFEELKRSKRNFLSKTVLPKMTYGISEMNGTQIQAIYDEEFVLPKIAWINNNPYKVTYTESQFENLKQEKELLDKLVK